jgi:hypothetical protein
MFGLFFPSRVNLQEGHIRIWRGALVLYLFPWVLCDFGTVNIDATILEFPILDDEAPASVTVSLVTFLFCCPMVQTLGESVPSKCSLGYSLFLEMCSLKFEGSKSPPPPRL